MFLVSSFASRTVEDACPYKSLVYFRVRPTVAIDQSVAIKRNEAGKLFETL